MFFFFPLSSLGSVLLLTTVSQYVFCIAIRIIRVYTTWPDLVYKGQYNYTFIYIYNIYKTASRASLPREEAKLHGANGWMERGRQEDWARQVWGDAL